MGSSSSLNKINISKTNSLQNQNTFDIIKNYDKVSNYSNLNKKQQLLSHKKHTSIIDFKIQLNDIPKIDQMIIKQSLIEQNDQKSIINYNFAQILEDNLDYNKIIEEKYQFKKLKFFDILNENIVLNILSYLDLKSLSKFATLSRKARKIIPASISQINNKNQYKNRMKCLQDKHKIILNSCKKTIENQQQYQNLIKKQGSQIQKYLETSQNNSNIINEEVITFLLFYIQHNLKQKLDQKVVIKFILSKGIKQVFVNLELDYIKPIKKQLIVPQIKQLNQQKPFDILVSKAVDYVKRQLKNEHSHEEQMYGNKILNTINDLEKTLIKKQSFQDKYNNSILQLRKTTNLFEYLNKNNIQIIIKFLNYSDIQNLIKSNKSVKLIVQEAIKSLLEHNQNQTTDTMHLHGLNLIPAKCIVFNLYFTFYQLQMIDQIQGHHCYLQIYKDLYVVFNDVLFSKFSRHSMYKKQLFLIQKSELQKIENTLSQYTDSFIESNVSENYQHQKYKIYELRNHLIMFQKFLINRDQHQANLINIKKYLKFNFKLDQQSIYYLLLLDDVKLSNDLKILKEKQSQLLQQY